MRNLTAVLGLLLSPLAAHAARQPITGADVLKIRNIAAVAIGPDNRTLAFVRSERLFARVDTPASPARPRPPAKPAKTESAGAQK